MKISVIIPVYNVGRLLCKSVDSILGQQQDNTEIIIVDDGSTDDSGQICDEYANQKNIRIVHKKNGGLSSARNAGIDIAKGDYLLFLDSDDYLRPGSISLLSGLIEKEGNVDFVQFRYSEVSDYSDTDAATTLSEITELTSRREMFEQKIRLGGIGASACTKLINRHVFEHIRFKEGIIHEDEQFTIHLINRASKALYISNELYMYVQRPGSIITSKFSKKRLDIIPVMEEQIEILNKNGYHDLAKEVRNNLFSALCVLYTQARRLDTTEYSKQIRAKAKELLPEVSIGSGTVGLIARGMRYHLPMLELYHMYRRISNGKA
ncbi:MAG: glycosyltransferase [Muribaculaceae bacterium]|nr:glycosyltransferase [Muribaculaceae bacterium]